MLCARVWRGAGGEDGGELIMDRQFSDPDLSLAAVVKKMETYILQEKLNIKAECTIRVRFGGWQ